MSLLVFLCLLFAYETHLFATHVASVLKGVHDILCFRAFVDRGRILGDQSLNKKKKKLGPSHKLTVLTTTVQESSITNSPRAKPPQASEDAAVIRKDGARQQ